MTNFADAPLSPEARTARRWLLRGLRLAIVAALAWYIADFVWRCWPKLVEHKWTASPGWLALAGVLYLAGLAPCALFFRRVLSLLGGSPPLFQALRAYYVGHLGKYVPGKAMVVILRAGLLRVSGVDAAASSVSAVYETLTMMAVGAFLAAAVLIVWFREQAFFAALAAGLMLLALAPTLPPVFRRLLRLARLDRLRPDLGDRVGRLGLGTLALGWLTIAAGWLLIALSLWATLRGLGAPQAAGTMRDLLTQMPLYTAAVSLAIVAGFLSMIPGGAGVREAVFMALLAGSFGREHAVIAAVLVRIVWLGAELAISAVVYFLGPHKPRSKNDVAESRSRI
ncbi:MAG: UPF0104 family protein [Planctomycetia bacterium]|nr:UPF0104 family protein [Planctomycetia bacterium]